jgi:hypothetical protein
MVRGMVDITIDLSVQSFNTPFDICRGRGWRKIKRAHG